MHDAAEVLLSIYEAVRGPPLLLSCSFCLFQFFGCCSRGWGQAPWSAPVCTRRGAAVAAAPLLLLASTGQHALLVYTLHETTCQLLPALQVMDGERKARGEGSAEALTAVEEIFGVKVRAGSSFRSPASEHPTPAVWDTGCCGKFWHTAMIWDMCCSAMRRAEAVRVRPALPFSAC